MRDKYDDKAEKFIRITRPFSSRPEVVELADLLRRVAAEERATGRLHERVVEEAAETLRRLAE